MSSFGSENNGNFLHQNLCQLEQDIYLFRDSCNVYIIKDGNRAVLVDFGTGRVLNVLDELGITDIDAVIHTNHHRDVCGGDELLGDDVKIYVPRDEEHLFGKVEEFWQNKKVFMDYSLDSVFFSRTRNIKCTGISDGETIQWQGCVFKIISTPGDSKGAISVILDKGGKRFVFCGDLISEPGKVHNIYDFQWHYLPHPMVIFSDWVKSLEKVDSLCPDLLCPSHGNPMEDAHEAIRLLISRINRLQRIMQPERKARATLPFSRVLPHLIYVCDTTYLILSGSGKGMIIDYGYLDKSHIDRLSSEFGLKAVDLITVTHYHDDHTARVPELQYYQAADRFYPFSEVKVCTIEELADVLENPGAYRLPCLPAVPIHPQMVLKPGNSMKWEEYELYFYHLPGQTHYAMGLFLEIDGHRVLFTGDNIWPTVEGGLVTPILFKNIVYPQKIVEAACLMKKLNPDILATGHYGAFGVNPEMLSGYVSWSVEMRDGLYEIVSQDPLLNGIDPAWASFYPYTVYVHSPGDFTVWLRLINHSKNRTCYSIALKLPDGFESSDPSACIEVAGGECVYVRFDVKAPAGIAPGRRLAATAEITGDGRIYGEIAEFVIEIKHPAARN